MRISLMASVAAVVALCAGPVAAQTVDWRSELNRTWWNGVTGAEIRELVAEAGGVWSDEPDEEGIRVGRITWPDLYGTIVRETDCPTPERPIEERNCGTMLLSVAVDEPEDIENWWLDNGGWLAYGRVGGEPALYRLEHSGFGTTRGHVLSTLMLFRARAVQEFDRIEALDSSGW
jgi:hypothetical protein